MFVGRRLRHLLILTVLLLMAGSLHSVVATEIPRANLPALVTSAGQSPDALMTAAVCDRYKIMVQYDALAEPKQLEGIRTLIVVMGGSAKGLGAAGIDEDEELARIKRLLDRAKKLGIYVVGVHVGGEGRRGPLSRKFIDAVVPSCKYIVVKEDGNRDGYFTDLGASLGIPVTVIKETLQLGEVLKKMFGIE